MLECCSSVSTWKQLRSPVLSFYGAPPVNPKAHDANNFLQSSRLVSSLLSRLKPCTVKKELNLLCRKSSRNSYLISYVQFPLEQGRGISDTTLSIQAQSTLLQLLCGDIHIVRFHRDCRINIICQLVWFRYKRHATLLFYLGPMARPSMAFLVSKSSKCFF